MPTSSSDAFCCMLCRRASIASATTVSSPMAPAVIASLSVVGCSKPVPRVPSTSLPTITPKAIARSPLLTSPSVLIAVAPCGGSQSCHAPATLSHSPVTRHDVPTDAHGDRTWSQSCGQRCQHRHRAADQSFQSAMPTVPAPEIDATTAHRPRSPVPRANKPISARTLQPRLNVKPQQAFATFPIAPHLPRQLRGGRSRLLSERILGFSCPTLQTGGFPMAEISPLRRRMIEDMTVRNLSPATQQSYLNAVSKFSRYFGRSPDRLGLEDVHAFQVHLVATGISWPALNQIVCALRFFYGVTLGQAIVPERITYARQPSKLPVVLSADEVVRFLEAIPSLKSRTALTTVYAAGLRVSEVVLLKIADIDSQRMVIRVEQGKGGKDRYVMLSPQLLRILRTYWRLARPKRWLFPGRDDERPLVPNVLHAACRSACAAAGLSKQVTVHTLRHTFATHLLESGADVRIIQVLLGHASLASTARYTRVATKTISNTPSPLDRLRLEVVPPG